MGSFCGRKRRGRVDGLCDIELLASVLVQRLLENRQGPDKLGSLFVSVVILMPSGMSIRARVFKQLLPMHHSHGRF